MLGRIFRRRTLVEDELFTTQLADLGSIKHIDEALSVLFSSISAKPEAFDLVPGTNHLRVAKSNPYRRNPNSVPALKVWFSIEDDNTVRLRAITTEM